MRSDLGTRWVLVHLRISVREDSLADRGPKSRETEIPAGVPLNTVRDLLGHSSVAMSLRYAHLAPDQRCEAVAKLDERPLFAITKRLPWHAVSAMGSYVFEKPAHGA
jgi:hypothetical protein